MSLQGVFPLFDANPWQSAVTQLIADHHLYVRSFSDWELPRAAPCNMGGLRRSGDKQLCHIPVTVEKQYYGNISRLVDADYVHIQEGLNMELSLDGNM